MSIIAVILYTSYIFVFVSINLGQSSDVLVIRVCDKTVSNLIKSLL